MKLICVEAQENSKCDWLEKGLKFFSTKWTARVILFLSERPRGFGDLRRNLGGVSAKVLSQRLKALENAGVVHRSEQPTNPPRVNYSLTDEGKNSIPVMNEFLKFRGKLKI
jgi:DNA-binding HxlR family transcriptional regulator